MFRRVAAVVISALFVAPLLMPPSVAYGETGPEKHPEPWPIQKWHFMQPTEKQLKSLHAQDVTPEEADKIDQLYWELQGDSLGGSPDCDAAAVSPKDREQCRASTGKRARVLPARPVPMIMAPSR